MPDPKQRLPNLSDRLLAETAALQRLEREKRKQPISTPEFHRLAEEVERHARRVFRLAAEEEETGDRLPTGSDSIDDLASRRLP